MRNVEGESGNSMSNYYENSLTGLKNHINAQDENLILTRDVEELTEFFVQDYLLPKLEVDSSKDVIIKKEESSREQFSSYVKFKIGLPLILEEGIEKTISMRASTYLVGMRFSLEDGHMTSYLILDSNASNASAHVETTIGELKQTIVHKNESLESGNSRLKTEIKKHIEMRKQKLKQENKMLESVTEKLNIKLHKNEDSSIIDLKIKKKIRMAMPEPKQGDPQLEKETLDTIIELTINQCRQFENTPVVFAKMEEEELRDLILGMLNSVFPGDATGESFVKTGKTDIRLKHLNLEGGILSSECKFWSGEKMYQDTIDQHFSYLTWKQDYAIQITFSKNVGFSEVLDNAKKAATSHKSYVEDSLKEINKQYFVTKHLFPEDPKKIVEVHHLVFDLHVEKK